MASNFIFGEKELMEVLKNNPGKYPELEEAMKKIVGKKPYFKKVSKLDEINRDLRSVQKAR